MKNRVKKQKKEDGIPMRRAFANNVYAVRLLSSISKKRVVWDAVIQLMYYVEELFFSAFFMRYLISAMETEKSFWEILLFLAVTQATFCILSLTNNYIQGSVYPVTNVSIYKKLYQKLFAKSRNVELSCFEDSNFYNRYTLAMDGAADRISQTVNNIWGVLIGAVAAAIAFTVMYKIDKISVLFVIFPLVGNFLFNNQLNNLDYKRNKEIAPHMRRVEYVNRVMYLADYAKEMRLSRVFSMLKRKYNEGIEGSIEVTKKYRRKGIFLHWFRVMFTFTFIFEGVLLYGAYQTMVAKTMSLAELAVLSSVMVSTTWILIGFADSLVTLFKNGLFVENLRTFLEYKPRIPEDYDGENPGDVIQSIEFRNVSFSYKDESTIKNLTFELRGGCTYALVGHNGAGKSTIIKLLMRLYDPTEGEILLNGKNIKAYNLKQYRALFATAFQDYQIFSMSVMDNVLMRRGTADDEAAVTHALQLSGVYDKVMSLNKGIHTVLTKEFDEDGAVLSGGEFQKIVAARAFIKECPIKIFDEPSSALDPIAEYELFENIINDSRDKTMLFISHRLSSVQNADWVFMLENGTIIEQGSHNKLMAKDGVYADMYRKQAKNYLAHDDLSDTGGIFTEKLDKAEVLL